MPFDAIDDTCPWGVVPASLFRTSMHRLADGGYLVQNTYAVAPSYRAGERLRARSSERQLLSLRRQFPHLSDLQLERSSGGAISFFRNANGFFGEVAACVYAAPSSEIQVCPLYG